MLLYQRPSYFYFKVFSKLCRKIIKMAVYKRTQITIGASSLHYYFLKLAKTFVFNHTPDINSFYLVSRLKTLYYTNLTAKQMVLNLFMRLKRCYFKFVSIFQKKYTSVVTCLTILKRFN